MVRMNTNTKITSGQIVALLRRRSAPVRWNPGGVFCSNRHIAYAYDLDIDDVRHVIAASGMQRASDPGLAALYPGRDVLRVFGPNKLLMGFALLDQP